jgi:hypothetical protein
MLPKFDDLDDDEVYDMMTTGIEVMRCMRDGVNDTEDDRARSIIATLTSDN